jgi:uncharacterized membrane protein
LSVDHHQDFNEALSSAIDETILEVLSEKVLTAMYEALRTKHAVTREELPYRTETMYQVLESVFGVQGAKTMGIQIARKFYSKLGLTFYQHEGYMLHDYVEDAKSKI